MLIGQSVVGVTDTGNVFYGPWFPREADAATFFIEVIYGSSTSAEITAAIEHKNSEDPDSAATTAATFAAVSPGSPTVPKTDKKSASGLKELVRFKYTVKSTGAGEEWIHFRMNPPMWQPN